MVKLITITPAGTFRGDVSNIPDVVQTEAAPVIAAAESGAAAIMAAAGASYGDEAYKKADAAKRQIEAAMIAANKGLILSALKAAGVTSAVVEYAGDGDSGGVTDTTLNYVDGQDKAAGASVYMIQSGYGWVKDPGVTISVRKLNLVAALDEFSECDMVSHFGHSGYENNDGGYGTVTFDVEEGSITLDHSDYIMNTEDYSHEL